MASAQAHLCGGPLSTLCCQLLANTHPPPAGHDPAQRPGLRLMVQLKAAGKVWYMGRDDVGNRYVCSAAFQDVSKMHRMTAWYVLLCCSRVHQMAIPGKAGSRKERAPSGGTLAQRMGGAEAQPAAQWASAASPRRSACCSGSGRTPVSPAACQPRRRCRRRCGLSVMQPAPCYGLS